MPCKSQKILAFVVPTIIAFISIYWYRKRKKLESSATKNTCSPTLLASCKEVNSIAQHSFSAMEEPSSSSNPLPPSKFEDEKSSSLSINCNGTINEMRSPSYSNSRHNANHKTHITLADEKESSIDNVSALSPSDRKSEDAFHRLDQILAQGLNISFSSHIAQRNESQVSKPFPTNLTQPKSDCDDPDQTSEMADSLMAVLPVSSNSASENEEKLSNDHEKQESLELVDDLAYVTGTSSPNTGDKDSPLSFGSPVSQNNETSLDFDAVITNGTSSSSLNEFISLSVVEKEQALRDSRVESCMSVDSGIGRTVPNDIALCATNGSVQQLPESLPYEVDGDPNFQLAKLEEDTCNPEEAVSSGIVCSSHEDKYDEEVPGSSTKYNNQVQLHDPKAHESSMPNHYIYEFEIPQSLCGHLIGKQGKHVKFIKERTNASVYIQTHPFDPQLKLAVVEGHRSEVRNALEMIRKKFPPAMFPTVTMIQTNATGNTLPLPLSESLQRRCLYLYYLLPSPSYIFNSWLHNFADMLSDTNCSKLQLPEGSSCDVILSSMVNAGHFFLQQPTHPSYPSLSALDQCMMTCYSQAETPPLPQPIEAGVICAASVMGGWYRAQVMTVYENSEEVEVKFVDYGGYTQVLSSTLRQIRSDFMTFPFQATECYLANIQPIDKEVGWTPDASAAFEELAQGQILQAMLVDYHEDGTPLVQLYRVQGISSTFINMELVERGFAKWLDQR